MQRAVRFTPTGGEEVLKTYRAWTRSYDRERQSEAALKTWETLSQKKRWLHWEEVIEVVKEQRDVYEGAPTALSQAKEGVRLAVLLLYCCLPPGRSQEYRTLKFLHCRAEDLRPTVPTPPDRSSNLLYLSAEGDQAGLFLGTYKTKKTNGPQTMMLDDAEYFVRHIDKYIKKHRPRLLALQSSSKLPQHDYLFVVSIRARASVCVCVCVCVCACACTGGWESQVSV